MYVATLCRLSGVLFLFPQIHLSPSQRAITVNPQNNTIMSAAISFSEPDQYGQVHPEENPELLAEKLAAFDAAVADTPPTAKESLIQAQTQCPGLLTDDFKLQFLRCEVFNETLAAERYIKYWDKRVDIFGMAHAFQPLTQAAALKNDMATFEYGVVRLVVDSKTGRQAKDPSGRGIVFLDPSLQDKTKYTNQSMLRCVWYTFHAALEDEETQKRGMVFLVYPAKAKFQQFNRALAKDITSSIRGCLPGGYAKSGVQRR
jgi:hypothetical protein